MNILARLKRIGLLVISRGFGGTGGPAPTPPIITGPCMTAQVIDVGMTAAVADPSCSLTGLPDLSCSLLFGDVAMSGAVENEGMEGTAIDVC